MIVFFYLPYKKYQTNKQKYTYAVYSNISNTTIAFHFILHVLVICFGCLMFFILKFECLNIILSCNSLFIFLVILISYFIHTYQKMDNCLNFDDFFSMISYNESINHMNVTITNTSTANVCTKSFCYEPNTYYSNKLVSIPIIIKCTSKMCSLNDFPDAFFISIYQNISIDDDLTFYLNNISHRNYESNQLIQKKTCVAKKGSLSAIKSGRIATNMMLGLAIINEFNVKSIPNIDYRVNLNVRMVPSYDYNNIHL